jgi:hypothetical protein
MAEENKVNLMEDDTQVWATTIKTEPISPSSTPPKSPSALIPHKYGPKPKRPSSSPAPIVAPLRHEYPDSVPDFDETISAPPSAAPNGPRGLPKQLAQQLAEAEEVKADQDPLEVQITKLVRIPPAPPGLVPRSLPQTHPLSPIQQQFLSEQLAREQRAREQPQSAVKPATSGLQQVLDNLQQKYPEKQGHSVPTVINPQIVRHDPAAAPSVLVPLSAICTHCGAINLLVKEEPSEQTPNRSRSPL